METRRWPAVQTISMIVGLSCVVAAGGVAYVYGTTRELSFPELEGRFVPGVHGVRVFVDGAEVGSFKPWDPLEKNISLASAVSGVCIQAGQKPDCVDAPNATFRVFTEAHIVTVDGIAYTLERGAVPIKISDVTEESVGTSIRRIAEWARANQADDGSFPYMYYPSADRYGEGNLVLRQLITIQGIYAIAKHHDAGIFAIAEKAEQQLMEKAYRYDPSKKYAYFVDEDGIRLGSAAIGILMIRERGDYSRPLSDTEIALGEFILTMQRDDGSFQTFLQDQPTDVDDMFYSGEALAALARLSAASDDARYDAALEKGFAHYREKIQNDFWPQYAPWHMQAFAVYYDETNNDEHAAYVYWLAEGLIQTMLEDDPHARPDEVGRFFNPKYRDWGPPHSSSTGIYLEGLAYAYRLAKERGDAKEMERFGDAIRQGARALLQVQWTPASAYYVKDPARVVGHFKVSVTNNVGRIDQLGHAANALVLVQNVLWK